MPACASAFVASGLHVSTIVCIVALHNTLLADTSAKEILSHTAGVVAVILFGFIVAFVGTSVAPVSHVVVPATV